MTSLRYVVLFVFLSVTVIVRWNQVFILFLLTLTSSVQEDYQLHSTYSL